MLLVLGVAHRQVKGARTAEVLCRRLITLALCDGVAIVGVVVEEEEEEAHAPLLLLLWPGKWDDDVGRRTAAAAAAVGASLTKGAA